MRVTNPVPRNPRGLGGNLINSSGQFLEYFSEMLDEQILSSINGKGVDF